MNIVQAGDRTRLVLNLVREYELFDQAGWKITLCDTLAPDCVVLGDSCGAASYSVFRRECCSLPSTRNKRDIVFRRGKDGEGRIVVDLSDPGVWN